MDREDYTIGWICAIHPEFVAAAAVLEQEHSDLDGQSQADSNTYTLGSIGDHNIVIASLPEGEYGESSATRVANDMLHSFPNVRLGLLVGIGGGAPHGQNDVRLGDIVVSTPHGRYGGVIQYDFGKRIQDQEFHYVGSLNEPPKILRSAVAKLRKNLSFRTTSPRYEDKIDEILQRRDMPLDEYARPDTSTDRLYRSDFVPPEDKTPCEKCCGDDATRVQEREKRTKERGYIQVHYGLIASANSLVKDAKTRDKLSKDKGVLCFEMEAAGLMNGFPCLVIRGICDYADSHKNKQWQGYAAMAAATYARDLLKCVPSQSVLNEERIKDKLATMSDNVAKMAADTSRLRSVADDCESEKILHWITATDYSPHFMSCIQAHQAGTGKWFLDSSKFKEWLQGDKKTLFCQGIPGAGKSILASVVINHIINMSEEDESVGIAYIYCIFQQKERQSKQDMLASLVKQLARARSSLPDSIRAMYKEHDKTQTSPTFDKLRTALHDLVGSYSKVFIIVDALDECQADDGEGRTALLDLLFNLQGSTCTSIFATSRHNMIIENKFDGRSTIMQIEAQNEDIEMYLEGQMPRISLLDALPGEKKEKCKAEIKTTIVSIADGMFLLAKLHFESLTDKTSVSALFEALRKLPHGHDALQRAYAMTIDRIRSQKPGFRNLAERVLTLLSSAWGFFTAAQLSEALAVKKGDKELDDERKEMPTIMVSVCAGLVTIDGEGCLIRIAHETAREYLVMHMSCIKPSDDVYPVWTTYGACDATTNDAATKEAHKTMAIICLTYLSFKEFEVGNILKELEGMNAFKNLENRDPFKHELSELGRRYPFFRYAVTKWRYHVCAMTKERELDLRFVNSKGISAVIQLCRRQPPISVILAKRLGVELSCSFGDIAAFHVVAQFDVISLIVWLLNDDHRVIPMTQVFTALVWATFNGYKAVAGFLSQCVTRYKALRILRYSTRLFKPPLIDQLPKFYPLTENDVRILIEVGLKEINDAMLELAARRGRWRVKPVLEKGAETCHKSIEEAHDLGSEETTPLHIATQDGDIGAMKRLLEEGAALECRNSWGQTPLHVAAYFNTDSCPDAKKSHEQLGHSLTIQLLLDRGASLEVKDILGQTPLHIACQERHVRLVEFFILKGASLEARDFEGNTPLAVSVESRNIDLIRLLLQKGANAMSISDAGETPQMMAQEWGNKRVLKLMRGHTQFEA